jgi:MFS family permease
MSASRTSPRQGALATADDSSNSTLLPGISRYRGPAVVATATFLFWSSLYLYVPILPLHAEELGASLQVVGAVIAAYAIGQVLLRIPIGIASDIYGRKPFAVMALVLSALGAAWLGLAGDPWSLFAARMLTGFAAAGWVAISVLFASFYKGKSTATAMSIIMAVNTISLLVSTFLGGILAESLGNAKVFYGAAGVGVAGALLMLVSQEQRPARIRKYSIATFTSLLRRPLLLQVSAVAITLQFVTFGVNFGFLPVLAERLGATKSEVGYITTAGLTAAVLGTIITSWMLRRMGTLGVVLVASVVSLGGLLLMPAVDHLVPLGALQALNGLGRGLVNTVLISMALRSAETADRATAMGSYQALYAIGMLAGPAVSGVIAEYGGIDSVFWVCGAVTVLGMLIALPGPLKRSS